jgi:Do/DeqQ family serine protease
MEMNMRAAALVLFLSIGVGLLTCDRTIATAAVPGDTRIAAATAATAPPPLSSVLAQVSPSVVNISVQGTIQARESPLFQDPLFRRFFNLPEGQTAPRTERFQAAGSGVIIDAARGYVITNNHVVDRADKILVTLKDQRRLNATLVGTDPETDIALLRIEADRLVSMPMGDSKQLQVGDYVVAIGNPFGVGQTATFGIVSALGRTGLGIEGYEDFIQTDASVNPGNSGGALVDTAGRLVGINAAIISRGGGNVGIGFAIPIDMANGIVQQLIAYGTVSRGALGVTIQDLTPALAEAMGVSATGGAIVAHVAPQSAGAQAGLRDGDVIIALDGVPLASSAQLRNEIGQRRPRTTVRLTFLRDGRQQTATATLDALATPASAGVRPNGENDSALSGFVLGAIPADHPLFGRVRGAHVERVDPGSAADEAGLRDGDIIIAADRMPVDSPAVLAQIMRDRKQGTPLLLQVRRGEAALFIALS